MRFFPNTQILKFCTTQTVLQQVVLILSDKVTICKRVLYLRHFRSKIKLSFEGKSIWPHGLLGYVLVSRLLLSVFNTPVLQRKVLMTPFSRNVPFCPKLLHMIDDKDVESTETVSLILQPLDSSPGVRISRGLSTVEIIDNDNIDAGMANFNAKYN